MKNHTEGGPPAPAEAVVDLERKELLVLLADVQEDSGLRRVVDLDRKAILTNLRDVQETPKKRPTTVDDDNFHWLG